MRIASLLPRRAIDERARSDDSRRPRRKVKLVKRRGASGGRGGGGGSSSSSGGSRGGSSSGGSSSSGSSTKGISYGNGKSAPLSSLPGYSSRVSPQSAQGLPRQSVFGYGQYPYSYASTTPFFGYGRPFGGVLPIWGFWPVYWYTDRDNGDNSTSTNDTRPGGALTSAGFRLPNNESGSYFLYGDQFSVDAVLGPVLSATGAVNVSLPSDTSSNQTIQQYRDQSFLLLKLLERGSSAAATAPDANSTFVSTVNSTIGDTLPLGNGAHLVRPSVLWLGFLLVYVLHMM